MAAAIPCHTQLTPLFLSHPRRYSSTSCLLTPSQKVVPHQVLLLCEHGHHDESVKVDALTQHPEVGGQSAVSGQNVKCLTPEDICTDEVFLKQEKIVEQPRDITEDKSDEQILVHGDPTTAEIGEAKEDDKGDDQKDQRQ